MLVPDACPLVSVSIDRVQEEAVDEPYVTGDVRV